MIQNEPRYSQSQGLKLLESAVKEFGPLFTLEQIKPFANEQKLSDTNLRYLLSKLANAGWIEILKRGTYLVLSPLYSEEAPVYAIAAALIQPMAISHWSACAHHGFTTQLPSMIQATTPKKVITPEMRAGKAHSPRGRALWYTCGMEFEFIHVKQDLFWGQTMIWVNSWQQVSITDPERTMLDIIARPDIFGGLSSAMEIVENALDQIDLDRFVAYTLKYNKGSIIKRVGWVLETLCVPEIHLQPLIRFPVSRNYLLDTNKTATGRINKKWRLDENLQE